MRHSRDQSIWRWFDFFPLADRSSIVSLGEGGTPLIHTRRLGEKLGLANLYLKNDTVLPTGRSRAKQQRRHSVRVSWHSKRRGISTGNALRPSRYSRRGHQSVVMVPRELRFEDYSAATYAQP